MHRDYAGEYYILLQFNSVCNILHNIIKFQYLSQKKKLLKSQISKILCALSYFVMIGMREFTTFF